MQTERLHVYDGATRQLLIFVDLTPAVLSFCSEQPNFADCKKVSLQRKGALKGDLVATSVMGVPKELAPGTLIRGVRIAISNVGSETVPGTRDDPKQGYIVDVILADDLTKLQKAAFERDVLPPQMILLSGRLSITPSLAAGQQFTYTKDILVPSNIAPGEYCLGVFADSTRQIVEGREGNNIRCVSVRVVNR